MGKVLSRESLAQELAQARRNKKVVFTNGCFDLLHVGHVTYLQQARALGDLLVVALNSDSSVRKLKGESRPLQNEEDRAKIMAALGCVDFVTVFSEETPETLIRLLKPDVLVKGGDWKIENIVGGPFVQSYGGSVQSLPFVPGRSTSKIVEKIMNS
ncbi:MAG TPA: D-glycero-beta-D-manno-heptose 1-phosphate adenylyltransferase [Bdellovibrionales bacterium]|nr:D-glycero-beta-D-manno-heptose 1-phosphate adenylyltransferase [Bdellovibrionales bacterium]